MSANSGAPVFSARPDSVSGLPSRFKCSKAALLFREPPKVAKVTGPRWLDTSSRLTSAPLRRSARATKAPALSSSPLRLRSSETSEPLPHSAFARQRAATLPSSTRACGGVASPRTRASQCSARRSRWMASSSSFSCFSTSRLRRMSPACAASFSCCSALSFICLARYSSCSTSKYFWRTLASSVKKPLGFSPLISSSAFNSSFVRRNASLG
mmetsp:Transcript_28166/g.45830  ORF Transcript_28166/g.45830 Transcript_28166/m.45830 type:complete len:212 (-) Transcript_28166:258-893(-)